MQADILPEGRPFFSVIVPVYNRSDSVLPTLLSVARQTFASFECIVVDDGSADAELLAEVVRGLGDPRFSCVRRPNGGASAARNTGVQAAGGRYVAYLDSDDFYLPQKLERVAATAARHPGAAIYSRSYVDRGVERLWVRPDRAIAEGEDMADYLFVHNQFIPTCALALPRETALAVPFDPRLAQLEDPDLCFRLHRAGTRFVMIDEPLAVWTDTGPAGRLSHSADTGAAAAWLEMRRPLLSRRAIRGYRATVQAYYLAPRRPFRVLADLACGWLLAGVPLRIILRQALRAFMPAPLYRQLVNRFVGARGVAATPAGLQAGPRS